MTADDMTRLLGELVAIESPTYGEGVHVMAARLAEELTARGGDVRLLGPEHHVRADFDGDGAPLVVLGHTDTVWELGTLERLPFRIDHGRAYGPGTYDMKGGLVTILGALDRARQRRRPVRVVLTADEEMATRTGRAHLEEAARDAAAAFVVEAALPDGGLKTARKGLGRFYLRVQGRSAHAGTQPNPGVSAIEELARQVIRLHALRDDERGVSVNVGVVRGGTRENVVADRAEADVDVRVAHREDLERLAAVLGSLEPELDGAELTLTGGWTRPPLEPTERTELLVAAAQRHARELGFELGVGGSGGGSDGNLVGALGVPVLDGLGPVGGGAHADDEHVLLASLPRRAHLLARLLEDPGL